MLTQRQLFLQHVAQTSDAPLGLEIEKAEGVYLYDVAGKKYIDLISGIGVSALGHCHPKVVQAVQELRPPNICTRWCTASMCKVRRCSWQNTFVMYCHQP
jgi:4-aminobutyrate aminotransferase-like enzyme